MCWLINVLYGLRLKFKKLYNAQKSDAKVGIFFQMGKCGGKS